MRHIIVENFCPIEHAQVDLDRSFTLVIGDQATGKSTLAKWVLFCEKLSAGIATHLFDYCRKYSAEAELVYQELLSYFSSQEYPLYFGTFHTENFRITYEYATDVKVEIRGVKGEYSIIFRKQVREQLLACITRISESLKRIEQDLKLADYDYQTERLRCEAQEEVRRIFHESAQMGTNYLFIPAGRDTITLAEASHRGMDKPTQDFGNIVRNRKYLLGAGKIGLKQDVSYSFAMLAHKVLKGTYVLDSGSEYLKVKGEKYIPVHYASSGQQDALWLVNLLWLYAEEGTRTFCVIEEPESHLFPQTQLALMELIATFVNMTHSRVFITTHSPYILSAANVLAYSGRVERTCDAGSVIAPAMRIGRGELGAGLLHGGKYQDIIDEEGLIQSEQIETVATELNGYFDELIAKEYKGESDE